MESNFIDDLDAANMFDSRSYYSCHDGTSSSTSFSTSEPPYFSDEVIDETSAKNFNYYFNEIKNLIKKYL